MNTTMYNAMLDALQAQSDDYTPEDIAAIQLVIDQDASFTEVLDLGWSETNALEPIVDIDFTDYVEAQRSLDVTDAAYFHSLALAFEERVDLFEERSAKAKAIRKERLLRIHLETKARAGLRATTTTSIWK